MMNKTMMLLITMVSIAGTAMCAENKKQLGQGLLQQSVCKITQIELKNINGKVEDQTMLKFGKSVVKLVSHAYYGKNMGWARINMELQSIFGDSVVDVNEQVIGNIVYGVTGGMYCEKIVFNIGECEFSASVRTGGNCVCGKNDTQIERKDIMHCKRCLLDVLDAHKDEWAQRDMCKIGMFEIKGRNIEEAMQQLTEEINEKGCCCNIA